jgi:hypothetical protein
MIIEMNYFSDWRVSVRRMFVCLLATRLSVCEPRGECIEVGCTWSTRSLTCHDSYGMASTFSEIVCRHTETHHCVDILVNVIFIPSRSSHSGCRIVLRRAKYGAFPPCPNRHLGVCPANSDLVAITTGARIALLLNLYMSARLPFVQSLEHNAT